MGKCIIVNTEKGFKTIEIEDIEKEFKSGRVSEIMDKRDELTMRIEELGKQKKAFRHAKGQENKSTDSGEDSKVTEAEIDSAICGLGEEVNKLDKEFWEIISGYVESKMQTKLIKSTGSEKAMFKKAIKEMNRYLGEEYLTFSFGGNEYSISMKRKDFRLMTKMVTGVLLTMLWLVIGNTLKITHTDVYLGVSYGLYILISLYTYRVILRAVGIMFGK